MINYIRGLGRWGLGLFERLGRAHILLASMIADLNSS